LLLRLLHHWHTRLLLVRHTWLLLLHHWVHSWLLLHRIGRRLSHICSLHVRVVTTRLRRIHWRLAHVWIILTGRWKLANTWFILIGWWRFIIILEVSNAYLILVPIFFIFSIVRLF
jgi:hypothetical protein